jgi:hypothetical protein
MSQMHEIGMFTSPRTVLLLVAATSLLAFAPFAALALGVGPAGVTSDSHVGTLAPGKAGGLDNSDSGETPAYTTDTGTHDHPATSSRTNVTNRHTTTSMTNPRAPSSAIKDSGISTTGDDTLATTPGPLGANQKGDVGLGVEARMPGAAGR